MAGFPGDPAVRVQPVRRMASGDPYNLSSLTLSSHSGTHLDPPFHFLAEGAGADEVPLGRLNGPALVVWVPEDAPMIDATIASGVPRGTERVLFRTRNSTRWPPAFSFFPDYVALDPTAAEELLARGVRLIGLDSLSIERDPTGRFPVHHALLSHDCLILEGLVLGEAPAGPYELHCLPLRIVHGDGAPCRVFLGTP